ncbi:MAG: carbohydrate ABC transporter permease [Clostridiales bacterium]|nr:carbohydrate ABC transporter permease [Clostridiales bacterium]
MKKTMIYSVLTVIALGFAAPILIIAYNSFKGRLYITDQLFALPNEISFAGLSNYIGGIEAVGFWSALKYSLFITVMSVAVIVLFTSMSAWYIVRVGSRVTKLIYYAFAFSIIVPFQMVMYPLSKTANVLNLDNPLGIVIIYLGFGAGLSVFLFCGFVRSIPYEIEEAAYIDGCGPVQTYFKVVFPVLRPTAVTVAILNTMWIWNDYLLPYLLIGNEYKTIPVAVQYLKGGYGSIDYGYMMAVLVLAVIPIIVFYLTCQKYIVKGVIAGAVKG